MPALEPDLIVTGGKIVTLDVHGTIATAVAIKDGRFIAVGSDLEIETLAGPATARMALAGRTVIPGIVDSHCHPDSGGARVSRWIDLGPDKIASRDDLLGAISAAADKAADDAWLPGYRLNENKCGGYPTLAELDDAALGHPLFILRTDGHLGLANSAAFNRLNIDAKTPDPAFGAFDHDPATGDLTGLVRETAAHEFLDAVHADDTIDDLVAGLEVVFDDYLSHGITSVYNSLTSSKAVRAYQKMIDEAKLKLRVGIIASGREDGMIEALTQTGIRSGFGDDWLRLIAVEWCPDCSTSGRTAAYYEPYVGTPALGEPEHNTGMLLHAYDDLKQRALDAHLAGLQVCIEGVGDRGIDFALDIMEEILTEHPVDDHRMRVEHCCYVTPKILERLKKLKVIDSSATGFMSELGDAYRANRGDEAMRWMWPHRALIDAGIPAPGHSDSYVCTPNPFKAIAAMVTRTSDTGGTLDAPGASSQAVTVEEALRAYTVLGAYSGREENIKGAIVPGMLADLAVLDRDILEIPDGQLAEVKVETTMVDGIVRYSRDDAPAIEPA
jgi:hypothetical protein